MDQHIVGGPLNIVPSRDTRTDLLAWLNDLLPQATASGYEVPRLRKVEHCGNGVPYVLLLPQMLPYVHPQLLSRAKVPAKHDFEAVSNLKLMAEALHKNGIPPPEVLVDDVDKLIKGGFQANLQLLQWFRGLGEALTPQQCPDEYHKEPKPQHQHVNALDSPSLSSDRNAHIVQRGVPKEGSDSSRMATHSRMEAADAKRQLRTVSAGCSAGVGPAAVADTPSALSATNSTTVSRGEAVVNTKNSSSSRRTSTPVDRSRVTTPSLSRHLLNGGANPSLRGMSKSPTTRGRSTPRQVRAGIEEAGFRRSSGSTRELARSRDEVHKTPRTTNESALDENAIAARVDAALTKQGMAGSNIVRRGRDQPQIRPKSEMGPCKAVDRVPRSGAITPIRSQAGGRASLSSSGNLSMTREKWAAEAPSAVETVVSSSVAKSMSGKPLQAASVATPSMSAGISRSGSRAESSSEGDSAAAAAALLKATKERQFYYDKLRQLEGILLPLVEEYPAGCGERRLVDTLLDVLYASE